MISLKGISLFIIVLLLMGWKSSCLLTTPEKETDPLMLSCQKFATLYQSIGDSTITPDSAATAFKELFRELRQQTYTFRPACLQEVDSGFIFPVRGYYPQSSIGGRGKGYRPDGFDFFDSRVRKSHPAHDLFIRDRNNDAVDDVRCEHVDVLAFTGGVVLGTRENWTPDSQWRGGNCIWVYNPCLESLFYYAHNHTIDVKPGQWIKTGEILGKMGRTGFNAYPPRSTTHLHFMQLKITEEGLPVPVDPYRQLLEARVVDWE